MKRFASLFLCVSIMLGCIFCTEVTPVMAQPSVGKTQLGSTDTYYEYDSETKTLTISGSGETPNFLNNSSSQPWYLWRSDGSIENVIVEEGITTLGNYFLYCVCAANVSLPESLIKIGSFALAGNNLATQIHLGRNLRYIMNNAFYMCNRLESIVIPSAVTQIGSSAFEQCIRLSSVVFENMNAEITISSRAFVACRNLKSIMLPKGVTMGLYAVGYNTATANDIYDDLSVGVYKDSKACNYVIQNKLSYIILDSMVITEGTTIKCTSTSAGVSEEMKYYFTPETSTYYSFYSEGDVDVDCVLTDSNGQIVAQCSDISDTNLNFSISCNLSADEEYCYTVRTVYSTGEYTLSLISADLAEISINWSFAYTADEIENGHIDIAELIENMNVEFIYASGYIHSVPFSEGATYSGYTMTYDNRLNSIVTCGVNTDSISVGDLTLEFTISIEHVYVTEVIEPTVYTGGFTTHTCMLCGSKYTTDFRGPLCGDYYGRVVMMINPDKTALSSAPIIDMPIFDLDGKEVGRTDENGYFYVTSYQAIIIANNFGPARVVAVSKESPYLGDIPIVYCDYNNDGYVNAKDFGLIREVFGDSEYLEDNPILTSIDIDKNGVVTYDDWAYAMSFVTYGKIDESIYN